MRGNGSARGDNFAKIIYPRSQNLPDNARASIHEGRLPEAFGGADRGRWSRKGATRTPASRQPKLLWSRRASRAPLGALGGVPYRRCQPPRRVEAPAAVERVAFRESEAARSVHRGLCGAGLETPRAGRRRNGGLAALPNRAALDREMTVPLTLRERCKPAGPAGPRRPAH